MRVRRLALRLAAAFSMVLALAVRPAPAAGSPTGHPVVEPDRLGPRSHAGRPPGPIHASDNVPPPTAVDLPIAIDRGWLLVRAEAGMEAAAQAAVDRLPDTFARISADLAHLAVPARIEVRLVHRAEDLARVAPPGRGAPAWAIGVAWPDSGVLAVAARRGAQPIDLASTLDHELAHLALGAALGDRAPRWLHEGFAYLHSSDWSAARAQTLTGMAWSGDAIPLGELDRYFHGAEDEASRAYAEAFDLTAFLARRGRHADAEDDGDRWAFRDFLAALAAGATVDDAARQGFAAPMRDLYGEWYERLRQRYLMVPVEIFLGALWILGAVFLVLGARRRRRMNRSRLARWEIEEQARAAPPPLVPLAPLAAAPPAEPPAEPN